MVCAPSVVFTRYCGFLLHLNWQSQYFWNNVYRTSNTHIYPPNWYFIIILIILIYYCFFVFVSICGINVMFFLADVFLTLNLLFHQHVFIYLPMNRGSYEIMFILVFFPPCTTSQAYFFTEIEQYLYCTSYDVRYQLKTVIIVSIHGSHLIKGWCTL